MTIGGQNIRNTGSAVQTTYPADLGTLVTNAQSALRALHDAVEANLPGMNSVALAHLVPDLDRLYPLLDGLCARAANALYDRQEAEHQVVADAARQLMDGPS